MPEVRANENEFRSLVVSWVNEIINRGGYPFESASGDPSLATAYGVRFPDVQLWLNREAEEGFCGWELKPPSVHADDEKLVENAIEKAEHMKAAYFVTWNMRDAIIWQVTDYRGKQAQRLFSYPSLPITSVADLSIPGQRIMLQEHAQSILNDLAQLHRRGHLTYVGTEDWFFINRLTKTSEAIQPFLKQRLMEITASDAPLRRAIDEWAAKQGFIIGEREESFQTISYQLVYQLIGRILFFEVLRRFRTELEPISLRKLSESQANAELRKKFAEVRAIDYQAVFDEDLPDRIPIPEAALPKLADLLDDLERRDFAHLPQEVLGSVFENLIPALERHRLGQYFTREDLVDFITAFCVREKDAMVLDPTCGTGTFLIRAYDRFKNRFAVHDHRRLLSQIWGVDIAPFPAELATINLYRQDITNFANFPRILKKDFFQIAEKQKYEFPPNKPIAGDPSRKIHEALPSFDAIIGNPPYIRQEQIDKVAKDYSVGVIIPALEKDRQVLAFDPIELSGQSDIYAGMFVHATALLKESGRLGFVTSNSWLGAGYGRELQAFFLRHFKIIAIVESRIEPWFETAQVNTIFTILERCEDASERNAHVAKFVSVKKKLRDLIPQSMETDAQNRWYHVDRLVDAIEHAESAFTKVAKRRVSVELPELISDVEDGDFRIRLIRQSSLSKEVPAMFGEGHWGRFLRAPKAYFELRELLRGKLAPLSDEKVAELSYGLKLGITEFFKVSPARAKGFGIEPEFLKPILSTFRDVGKPIIEEADASDRIFVCHLEKNELIRLGKKGALAYIEWGEKQRTTGRGAVGRSGVPWPEVPSVRNRPRWYDLGKREPADVVINQFLGERIFFPANPEHVLVSNTFFEAKFADEKLRDLWVALMNSVLFYLFVYVHGRVDWSQGPLRIYGPEIASLLLPDARRISLAQRKKILAAFAPILKRDIKKIGGEVKQKDRRAFDSAVLEALGLDPKTYLDAIYAGLVGMVEARLKLGKMQKIEQKKKTTKDIQTIKKEVVQEVLPDALRPFPESFLPPRTKTKDVAFPAGKLRLGEYFLGKQKLVNADGDTYEAQSSDEARYILYAQKPDSHIVALPASPVALAQTVQKYRAYIGKVREDLMRAFVMRTGDAHLSERLCAEVLEDLGAAL